LWWSLAGLQDKVDNPAKLNKLDTSLVKWAITGIENKNKATG